MTWRMNWAAGEVTPAREATTRAMGMRDGASPSPRTAALLDQALAMFHELAQPHAAVATIDVARFADVFEGASGNDARTPLASIYPRAEALALYVATLGAPLTDTIGDLFARNDPALAYVLDTLASESADLLSRLVGDEVALRAHQSGLTHARSHPLAYSPGYCGWHVSGQRPLFDLVRPEEEIGVTLTDSFLMQPLKSVSGVIIVAPLEAHAVGTDFDCCCTCATRSCEERLSAIEPA